MASLSPELYLDPNQIMRKELKEGTLLAKKDATKASDSKDKDKDKEKGSGTATVSSESKSDANLKKASAEK